MGNVKGNVKGKLSAPHKWALGIVLFTTVAILAGVNWRIFKFEQLLNHGQVVRFALAPVDPRSLMQGDYMALEYAIARNVRSALAPQQMQGQLLLALDEQKVAGRKGAAAGGWENAENGRKNGFRDSAISHLRPGDKDKQSRHAEKQSPIFYFCFRKIRNGSN